jgi:hypothetical protein
MSQQPSAPRGPVAKEIEPAEQHAPTPSASGSDKVQELLAIAYAKKNVYDKVVLPSKGKFYDGSDGPRDGIIHLRQMTGEEEQILATPRFIRRNEAINMIFERCIQEKFKPARLLSPDRTYLLIYLRAISYTPDYDVEVKCPHCDRKFNYTINLSDLNVDTCPEDFDPSVLTDILPVTGWKFRYRISTGEDEQKIQAYRERKLKFEQSDDGDDTLHYRNAQLLEEIEGVTDKYQIQKLLTALPIQDIAYLRTKINEPPFGVDTKVNIACGNCLNDFDIDLPLEANFFFPRAKKKARTQA